MLSFIREYPFDRLGAFAFSPEEGTAAALMENQIPEEIKQQRLKELMAAQQPISLMRNRRWEGRELEMLIEEITPRHTIGEAPDVDGRVILPRKAIHAVGGYIPVRLTQAKEYDMLGQSLE